MNNTMAKSIRAFSFLFFFAISLAESQLKEKEKKLYIFLRLSVDRLIPLITNIFFSHLEKKNKIFRSPNNLCTK